MAQHLIVNITWQDNYWTGEPSKEDFARASHRYVSSGNIGHEFLNFNLDRNVVDDYKVGFFQATRQPTRFTNGKAHIFLYSKQHIVGIYGFAEVGSFPMIDTPDKKPGMGNIRAAVNNVVRFKDVDIFKIDPERHMGGKERMGQIGFIYIDDNTAHAILDDAIKLHEDAPAYRDKIINLRDSTMAPTTTKSDDSFTENTVLTNVFKKTRNIILYGPPGTGKTYQARQFARWWVETRNSVTMKSTRRFWCVVANPNEWHWDNLFKNTNIEGFRSGKIKRNYSDIKAGDLIFGYLAHPAKQIYCLVEATEAPADSKGDHGFYVKGLKKIENPISWNALKDDPILKNSEPVRHRMQGTLFRLEPQEVDNLRELIESNDQSTAEIFDKYFSNGGIDYNRTITFHQSFGYEDFIEGLRPVPQKEGGIGYEWSPGIFKQLCDDAGSEPDKDFILIIDEINRGNISRIFGELITLLEDDKRLGNKNEMITILPGSKQSFGVPDNLYIIGTMNTADRSIALLDIALRRRFTFIEIKPDSSLISDINVEGISLSGLLNCLNTRLETILDRDHCIGHSYFMGISDLNDLRYIWYNKIMPLLGEYFYNDGERLKAIVDDFIEEDEEIKNVFANPPETYDPESKRYRIADLTGTQFVAALEKLALK